MSKQRLFSIKRNKYFPLLVIVFISIGFALATAALEIGGSLFAKNKKWDVHFENLEYFGAGTATLTDGIGSFETDFKGPGDEFELVFTVKNDGNMDAAIDSIITSFVLKANNNLLQPYQQKDYFTYTLTYDNGIEVRKNDILEAGSSEKIHFNVKVTEDYSMYDQFQSLSSEEFTIVYKPA